MKPKRSFLGKMWRVVSKDDSFSNQLYHEVETAAPSAQLSYSLKYKLERTNREDRVAICSKKIDGCSPLFVACRKGNVEIVEYLISICGADVEQKGFYEVANDRSVHTVTPLWCAGVSGNMKVVEVLLKYGADINAVSDTGSTPVRSACFMTHFDVVKMLVESGADIQKPNHNGGTCLINSVQSVELCEYLLSHGADVNAQDIQNKTALHYAIQEHRLETTKMLLQFGANPFLRSKYGDDALQTACLKGAEGIVNYLVDHVEYTAERVASAFELIGATFHDEHHDRDKALAFWRAACDVRTKYNLAKPILPAKKAYLDLSEFSSKEELNENVLDPDYTRFQSLIISERILGANHKDTIYRVMYRGASYADSMQYQKCLDIWLYALELKIARYTVLYCDTCFTVKAIVRLIFDLHQRIQEGNLDIRIRAEDVMTIIEMLATNQAEYYPHMLVHPKFQSQEISYNNIAAALATLIHLLLRLPDSEDANTKKSLHKVIKLYNPRTSEADTLLHTAVKRDDRVVNDRTLFPSLPVAKLLIECGASVNAADLEANTPLHLAAANASTSSTISNYLLSKGAHIDQRNKAGITPLDYLRKHKINILKYQSLQCLAAVVICKNKISYHGKVPAILEEFIEAH